MEWKKITSLAVIWMLMSYAGQGQRSSAGSASQKTLYAADFVSDTAQDAVQGVLDLLEMARKTGASRIVFKKGVYHFYDDHAFWKYCFISNHDSGPKKIAFPLSGFKQLEIDGNGSEFIMHGLIIPFLVDHSSNITIRNVSIDWYRPTHSELTVVAVDSQKQCIDFKIADEYPYEIRNHRLIFVKKGMEHNLENAVYWDPHTHGVAFQSRQLTPPLHKVPVKRSLTNFHDTVDLLYGEDRNAPLYKKRGTENTLFATQIKPGLVRLAGVKAIMPEVGWVLVCKGANGNNRLAPAVVVSASQNVSLENVNVHHASGMGFIAQNSADLTLDHFNVFPKPEDHRTISTTADATHFVNCRGLIQMENCLFENQFDDATNIHGIFMKVTDIKENEVGAYIGHSQQEGSDFARPGDSIAAVNPAASELPVAWLIVESTEKINPRYYRIKFKNPVPKEVKAGFYIVNMTAYPEVVIRNNRFLNNRARGLLISTPRKVIIEGNTFSNMMAAIKCHSGFSFWYESGYVKDLTIENNTFLDGYYGAKDPGALIDIAAQSGGGKLIHGKIIIKHNVFNSFASAVVSARYVKNLVFEDNIIKYSGNYPIRPDLPVLDLKHIGRAQITNNRYAPQYTLFLQEEQTGALVKKENKILDKEE